MATRIFITEPYYKEFHKRKGSYFDDTDAIEIYKATQELRDNWPACLNNVQVLPDVVKEGVFYYLRFNFLPPQQIKFRICFGVEKNDNGDVDIVGLTCRTKQELARGGQAGTQGWKKHMKTVGKSRWNEYRRKQIRSWQIY